MHTTITRRRRTAVRAAGLLVAAALTVLADTAPSAAADGNGNGNGIAGYGNAQQVLRSGQVRDTVSRFLVAARQQPAAPAAAADGGVSGLPRSAPNAVAAPPSFDLKDPVPLYELSPEFVTGKAGATPDGALRLSYLTSRVAAGDGRQASVLLAPQPDGQNWQLAGIRDGDAEIALAERGSAQARTFAEPQLHAWYRLTEQGRVEALNPEATGGLGGKPSLTLAEYQKLVTARYGDKQPGSAYDRKGLAGGWTADGTPAADDGLASGDGTAPGAPAGPVAAAPAATAAPASALPWQVPAAGAGLLAAVAGGAAVLRRRRRPLA
ncbi:hypothetical protein [Kitasatospora camelliae]|uniref:LPXTG-motif cell wall-anchored protein n=1 Tax=Kitasatospora camelliae TaxID=3156397 RepID=A0AAU8K596_9ACTN